MPSIDAPKYIFKGYLGKPTPEYLEEQRQRELLAQKIRDMTKPIIMAGNYEVGARIKAKIIKCPGIKNFSIKSHLLNSEHFQMMRQVREIRFRNGSLMHLARPYTSDLGQYKLFYDSQRSFMHRCEIEDMYTICKTGQRIEPCATILLIDIGLRRHFVSFKYLYDMPQAIATLKDINPEVLPVRIYLGEPVPKDFDDQSINNYFREIANQDFKREYTIKILDFVDNVYHVDILDNEDRSFIEHLRMKFQDKIQKFELENGKTNGKTSICELSVVRQFKPVSCIKRTGTREYNNRFTKSVNWRAPTPPRPQYNGVIKYYKQKFAAINDMDTSSSWLQKRFFRVRVIYWANPESFFIIPDDPDYLLGHARFVDKLKNHWEIIDEHNEDVECDKPFFRGQKCLFRNEVDKNLGKWLRGVILDAPATTMNGSLQSSKKPSNKIESNIDEEGQEERNAILESVDYIYLVRSIDYGFLCARSSMNLRHVRNERLFTSFGPWALRCQLFGIEPTNRLNKQHIDSEGGYSLSCLDMIDGWMRSKILDKRKFSFFHILFRSDINRRSDFWQSDDDKMKISLFHRHEPPYRIEDSMLPKKRKSKFNCLNWYLVDRGGDEQYINQDESSGIEFDPFIVNLLVPHDRI